MSEVHIGENYGSFTVLEVLPKMRVICRCECGKIKNVYKSNLVLGKSKSCGCHNSGNKKHGGCRTRLYTTWLSMKSRCNRSTDKSFCYYGAKGVKVCDEWNDFVNFRNWALSHGYTDELTIDRIDVNGNYEPENCRWITKRAQQFNKTTSHYLTFEGKTMTVCEWAEALGLNKNLLYTRLQRGWTVEDTLTRPSKKEGLSW